MPAYSLAALRARRFSTVYGVDFSGARLAGRTLWVARAEPRAGRRALRLVELVNLERAAGSPLRERALGYLVEMIRRSSDALWGIDAPFGLPVEVLDPGMTWAGLMRFVRDWRADGYDLGLWCLARARARGGPQHVYRATDRAARAPFDCYHYRIIYQTFHVMRDVLWPLRRSPGTAILPFHYGRLRAATRVLVETCPSSTLKRLGLPHHTYKQPEGGPLTGRRRRTRQAILEGLGPYVEIGATDRARIMRDGGGDALDAVIAAAGVADAWRSAPHEGIAGDARVRREGFLYA
ncbi:MAG TPA: DUF429 domain-containing protein [Thermodesulfobacteriota bacterium]